MEPMTSRSSIFEVLKQHFQNFTGPKTVELPVSAYGKLPVYKDFLRHGLAGAEAQAFKKWLDRGISKYWAANEAYSGHEILPHAFLFAFPATGRQLLGYLWGSHDHGGLRRFPFVLFVSLPSSRSEAPFAVLDALSQLVAQAAALREKIAGLSDVESFYPLIRTATISLTLHSDKQVREHLEAAGESLTVAGLGASLYGDDAESRWPALLAYLERLRSGGAAFSAARLPSSEALSPARLMVLWNLLLEAARNPKTMPLQVFFAPDEPAAGITIFHRDLRADDVFGLHMEMPGYEYILDLRHEALYGREAPAPLSDAQQARPIGALLEPDFLDTELRTE